MNLIHFNCTAGLINNVVNWLVHIFRSSAKIYFIINWKGVVNVNVPKNTLLLFYDNGILQDKVTLYV